MKHGHLDVRSRDTIGICHTVICCHTHSKAPYDSWNPAPDGACHIVILKNVRELNCLTNYKQRCTFSYDSMTTLVWQGFRAVT